MTYVTHDHIDVTWSPPNPSDVNGVLTEYSVCVKMQSSELCLQGVTVPFTQTSYKFSELRPYVTYVIEVAAATAGGYGPLANILQRTLQSGV